LALFASTASAAAQEKDNLAMIGELVFFSCQTCHVVGERTVARGYPNAGPHLNDLFGRTPGSLPDFEYSEAMIEFGQDKVWDEATLTAFLHDPAGVVQGNKMNFPGNKKAEELKAVLAYLATFDPDGMAPK
jgi:cytochrome c